MTCEFEENLKDMYRCTKTGLIDHTECTLNIRTKECYEEREK